MHTNLHQFVLGNLNKTPRKLKWTRIARETGVPYETLKKIASQRIPNPGILHVQTLADYFVAKAEQGSDGAAQKVRSSRARSGACIATKSVAKGD